MKITPVQPFFTVVEPGKESEAPVDSSKVEVKSIPDMMDKSKSQNETERGLGRLMSFLKGRKGKQEKERREKERKKALYQYEMSSVQENDHTLKGIKVNKTG